MDHHHLLHQHQSSSMVINGRLVLLPVGVRFLPTDEMVVELYLKRKVFHLPLPTSAIHDINVFLTHPCDLPGDLKEKRYFFTKQRSFLRKNVGFGVWKTIGEQRFIVNQGFDQIIGVKKSLVFSERTPRSSSSTTTTSTRWVMHEYRLPPYATTNPTKDQIETRDWAVYCLFQEKRRPRNQRVEENQRLAVDLREDSSCSSGLTEVSSNDSDQQEINSSG